jgi:glycosyltransferase involved in cell wall biosynthesis
VSATATTSDRLPVVSIVIPALDAATTIGSCLNAVLRQDYDGEFDVVVAVGPSSDRTREIVERLAASDPRVRVIDNPSGRTPTGLNLAVAASSGSVIARIDAQSVVPVGYVQRAVESMLRTGAANVGGIQNPIGEPGLQGVIAVAMASKFGAGPARFRRDGYEGPTDTVYLGVFDRDALEQVGRFDEALTRNQDYELNWRLRDSGHVVWLDPELVIDYTPRSTIGSLASQYFQYGTWKRHTLKRHPRSVQPRQVVAPLLVIGLIISGIELIRGRWRGLLLPFAYFNSALMVARDARSQLPSRLDRYRMVGVFATMHVAWGAGFLFGRAGPTRRTS